jgi:hypothetical protein
MNWIRFVALSALCLVAVNAGAAPVFWVSDSAAAAAPGLLDLTVEPNSVGQLHIWANSDVRLFNVSLNLLQTGDALHFTGATVHKPNARWAFVSTPTVTDSAVQPLEGACTGGGLACNSIGPGSPEPMNVLYATVDYVASGDGDSSSLALQVGANRIFDWQGNFVNVHFGSAASPAIPSHPGGGIGVVGTVQLIPEPGTLMLAGLAISPLAASLRRRAVRRRAN